LVVAATAVTVEDDPALAVSDVDLPPTAFPNASFSVTVTVEAWEPSEMTVVGNAETVESAALTGPGVIVST
jgi:hypothetical protein